MKVKTSVTLSKATILLLRQLAGRSTSRSQVIEHAVEAYAANRQRLRREANDLHILNRSAAAMNREMEDVLTFQPEA